MKGRSAATATIAVATMVAGSFAGLLAPAPVAAGLLAAAFLAMRRGRVGMLVFLAVALAFNVVLFGFFVGRGEPLAWGPMRFWSAGAAQGAWGAVRLGAIVAINGAVLQWVPPSHVLDASPLPMRAKAFLAALLLAVEDLKLDGSRLVDARRAESDWPRARRARIRVAATLVPMLLVHAQRRATTRAEALRLAGHDVGHRFAPLVAVSALALAGRILFAPVPNVSPTFLFVFLGGLVFGSYVGAFAGATAMALSNFMLSGFLPSAYVNVPAMMLLGLAGGVFGRATRHSPLGGGHLLAAGAVGVLATFLFSVASDAATWALVPEYRGDVQVLRVIVLSGLVFNVLPALANGALFAAAVGPVTRAFQAIGVWPHKAARDHGV